MDFSDRVKARFASVLQNGVSAYAGAERVGIAAEVPKDASEDVVNELVEKTVECILTSTESSLFGDLWIEPEDQGEKVKYTVFYYEIPV
jgi:hypothetical protein